MNEFTREFLSIVERYPLKCAVAYSCLSMTYRSLEEKVLLLASRLSASGVRSGHLVAIHIKKSPDYLIALLAIWRLKAAFVPFDPMLPMARQQAILEKANPNFLVHPQFEIEIRHQTVQYTDSLAYIIFTSGSTGSPKGVMVTHEGIVPFLKCQIHLFEMNCNSRALFYVSTNFDASISDIGTAFLSGAALCIMEEDRLSTAIQLPALLEKYQITHMDIPPFLLSLIDIEQIPSCVKTIIIGGEVCAADVVRQWAKKFRLIQVYGPTEATVCTSMIRCSDNWKEPLMGAPIDGMDYAIFQADALLSHEFGSEGELYISGPGLALGYVHDPVLTHKKFMTHHHKRYYRTGDWVRRTNEGDYIYLGRIDRQLKIRGQLVAPEEIEAAMNRHPSVRCAAVISSGSSPRKQLVAIVEASSINANVLTCFLKGILPAWMIPPKIVFVHKIPKNENGKIDYLQLNAMDLSSRVEPVCEAEDSIPRRLQLIWKRVLELPTRPSIDDDLVENLCADSLDVLRLIVCSEKEGLYFSAEILYELRTITNLTLWLQSSASAIPFDAMPASLLKRDCLTEGSEPRPSGSGNPLANARGSDSVGDLMTEDKKILLTGATGTLGIHVLYELMLQTTRPVICLVRLQHKVDALEKIKKIAMRYGIEMSPFMGRIQVMTGDISHPKLGTTTENWNDLCHTITDIYHCAAEVNMLKSYETLKPTNVNGTKEIALLASSVIKKRIFYASTLSVFVATDQNLGVCKENDTLEQTQTIYGGYAQSKWVAEYYLQHALNDATIFRLGLITGESRQGKSSEHDYLLMFIKGLQEMGCVPMGAWERLQLDATPVDYAAKALVYLSLHGQSRCYHLANTKGFSLEMIIAVMKQQGMMLEVTDASSWLRVAHKNANTAAAHRAICRLFEQDDAFNRHRSMDLFQATDVTFDQENTKQGLLNSGIVCPMANEALLAQYMRVWTLGIYTRR
jgi:amino acid adenylation domain-containing protein/thioester reductase-like protein